MQCRVLTSCFSLNVEQKACMFGMVFARTCCSGHLPARAWRFFYRLRSNGKFISKVSLANGPAFSSGESGSGTTSGQSGCVEYVSSCCRSRSVSVLLCVVHCRSLLAAGRTKDPVDVHTIMMCGK